ncbi:MAG: TlpA disulfide reductase family protein [Gammaproteobacteria bacterium]
MNQRLLLGICVVAVAAVGGFAAQRMLADRPTVTPLNAPAVVADANSAPTVTPDNSAEAPPSHVIPETVPAITLTDRHGATRTLTDWKGRPVIINFWATWCGPCRDEIPLLKALRNERASDRLEIVGVAIDERDAVLKYASDIGMDYPILIGEKEGYAAAEAFGVSLVLPFSVFADRKGRIVTLKVGELHADEAAFILDRVRDIDSNRIDLPAARRQITDKMRDLAVERGKKASQSG